MGRNKSQARTKNPTPYLPVMSKPRSKVRKNKKSFSTKEREGCYLLPPINLRTDKSFSDDTKKNIKRFKWFWGGLVRGGNSDE